MSPPTIAPWIHPVVSDDECAMVPPPGGVSLGCPDHRPAPGGPRRADQAAHLPAAGQAARQAVDGALRSTWLRRGTVDVASSEHGVCADARVDAWNAIGRPALGVSSLRQAQDAGGAGLIVRLRIVRRGGSRNRASFVAPEDDGMERVPMHSQPSTVQHIA